MFLRLLRSQHSFWGPRILTGMSMVLSNWVITPIWPHQTQSLIITRITVWTVCGLSCFQRITDWTCSFTQGLWKERKSVKYDGIGVPQRHWAYFCFWKMIPRSSCCRLLGSKTLCEKTMVTTPQGAPALGTCVGSTSFWRSRRLNPKDASSISLAAVLLLRRRRRRLLLLLLKTTTTTKKNYYY